jgi:hypothetical protein
MSPATVVAPVSTALRPIRATTLGRTTVPAVETTTGPPGVPVATAAVATCVAVTPRAGRAAPAVAATFSGRASVPCVPVTATAGATALRSIIAAPRLARAVTFVAATAVIWRRVHRSILTWCAGRGISGV